MQKKKIHLIRSIATACWGQNQEPTAGVTNFLGFGAKNSYTLLLPWPDADDRAHFSIELVSFGATVPNVKLADLKQLQNLKQISALWKNSILL